MALRGNRQLSQGDAAVVARHEAVQEDTETGVLQFGAELAEEPQILEDAPGQGNRGDSPLGGQPAAQVGEQPDEAAVSSAYG